MQTVNAHTDAIWIGIPFKERRASLAFLVLDETRFFVGPFENFLQI